jgi:hypothetical protein
MTETPVAEVAGPPTDDPDPAGGGGLGISPSADRLTPAGQSPPSPPNMCPANRAVQAQPAGHRLVSR